MNPSWSTVLPALLGLTVLPVNAQSLLEALDAPPGVTAVSDTWAAASGAVAHDGADYVHASLYRCGSVPFGSSCGGENLLELGIPGPGKVSLWRRGDGSYNIILRPGGFSQSLPSTPPPFGEEWALLEFEFGPGQGTLTAAASASSNLQSTYDLSGVRLDQLSVQPMAAVAVDEAVDLPGGWTSSGAWVGAGNSSLASSGNDYAYLNPPAAAGGTGWLERTVTGPVQVNWRWRGSEAGGVFQFLVDGSVVRTGGATGWPVLWESGSATVPAGTHTIRWQATAPATPSALVAALDAVTFSPALDFNAALGTTGMTWTTGGPAAWTVMDQSGIAGHSSVTVCRAPSGQCGWLETAVTGPGYLDFWQWYSTNTTVAVDGLGVPISQNFLDQRVHIPTGVHTVRFICENGTAWLDSISFTATSHSVASALNAPSGSVFVERTLYGYASVMADTSYTGGLALVSPPPDDGPGGICNSFLMFRLGESLLPGTVTFRNSAILPLTLYGGNNFRVTLPGGNVMTATDAAWWPGTRCDMCFYSTQVLDSIIYTPAETTTVAEGLDHAEPVTLSPTGTATGITGSKFGNGDALWLKATAAAQPAWAEITLTGPAYVACGFAGAGVATGNGRTDTINTNSAPFTLSWDVAAGVTTTIRWQHNADSPQSGLMVDNLIIQRPTVISLAEALDTTASWTPGGTGTWQGWAYVPWENGRGDFAQAPALAPGEETWLEYSVTGPFEIGYRLPAAGDRLRLEIDGVIQADTAVHPAAGIWRVQTTAGQSRRCRLVVSREAGAAGNSAVPMQIYTVNGSTLASAAAAFTAVEAVIWVDFPPRGIPGMMGWPPTSLIIDGDYGANNTRTGRAGMYVRGPGRCEFTMDIFKGNEPYPQWMAPPGVSGSINLGGSTTSYYNWTNQASRPFGSGLQCAVWNFFVESISDPLYNYNNFSAAALSNVRWRPGTVAYETWAGTRVTGFDAQAESDPDGDGVVNALEYLLGSNPAARTSVPAISAAASGAGLRVTAPLPDYDLTGSSLIPQTSVNLSGWTDAPGSLLGTGGGLRTYEIPPGDPRRFLRFRAALTP